MILCCLGFCLSEELQRSSGFKGREEQSTVCCYPLQEGGQSLLVHRYPVYHLLWLDRMLPWQANSWVPRQRQWLQMSQTVIAAGKTRLGSSLEVLGTWREGRRR